MADHQVDLLVIGAGASGASVAYEATRRGLRVALLEAGDIGGGTSCRSTRLLHGGVRYLELAFKTLDLAQLRLVREALLERSHALRNIWGDANYFNGRSMDVYIAKLRKHLRGDDRIEILNVHGKGFKLVAPTD